MLSFTEHENSIPLAKFTGDIEGIIYYSDKVKDQELNIDILKDNDEINAILDDYGIEFQEYQIIMGLLRQNKKLPPASKKTLRKAFRKVHNYIIRKNHREITFPEGTKINVLMMSDRKFSGHISIFGPTSC